MSGSVCVDRLVAIVTHDTQLGDDEDDEGDSGCKLGVLAESGCR